MTDRRPTDATAVFAVAAVVLAAIMLAVTGVVAAGWIGVPGTRPTGESGDVRGAPADSDGATADRDADPDVVVQSAAEAMREVK